MKRNLLLLLVLCMVHNIMAQTVIVCNTEGELPKLLSEKAQEATELVIRGVVSADDIKALNNYPKIKSLDLTDAQLLVIPSKAWDDLHLHIYQSNETNTRRLLAGEENVKFELNV